MTNHAHTPTTEQVRDGYSRKPPGHAVLKSRERQTAEFDRWLAERDARIEAAAEQRGAERAWDEAIEYAWDDSAIYQADAARANGKNPYRADRIANKEGDE